MNLIKCYQTQNDCYKKATPMKPVGIVVHSTGANNPNLSRYVDMPELFGTNKYSNHWNRAGLNVMVHGFIGRDKAGNIAAVNIMPYHYAAWGVGNGSRGSYNYNPTGHIQFEICEDALTDNGYFNGAFGVAIEYCAALCKEFALPVSSIVSHKEAHAKGYASNHGDCDHWLVKFGRNMDWFRAEVQKFIDGGVKPAPKPEQPEGNTYTVITGDTLSCIAGKYGTTWQKIAELNKLDNPGLIYPGQVLTIPGKGVSTPLPAPVTPVLLELGDKVRVKSGVTKFASGASMAAFVKTSTLYVRQLGVGKVLVSTKATGDITGWVNATDLERV